MSRMLCILYLIISVITIKGQELFNTSQAQIESQIDAAIKFMCINQFKSNGQFLYEIELTNDSILIDVEKNNYPRQGGGLYGIGMYYRLNHNKHNPIFKGFSIINCIDNTMRYLQSHSKTIKSKYISSNNNNENNINGELISGNTGATSLALMGLIDICIINDNICSKYSSQFELWLHGLITMRNHKLITIDNNTLHKGAFAKKATTKSQNKSSPYYDSESYVVLSKLLQYKQHLITNILSSNNEIWTNIGNILEGLDEYYIEFRGEDDAHWLIQAWYNRWVLLNSQNTNTIDNFMNYYMIEILMKNKLNSRMNIEYSGARCYLVEAITDVIYSVNVLINNSKYNNEKQNNSLYIWNDLLYKILNKRYKYMTQIQLFTNTIDEKYYFEERFNGGFISDSNENMMRIDDTQHCVCALMKINALIFMNKNVNEKLQSYTYIDYNDPKIEELNGNNILNNSMSYDFMISAICLLVIIVLVNIVFFYWCYYYPKQQKERNDLFWLGQTMESATSDANGVDSEIA